MQKPTCSIEGCSGVVLSRGWCAKHYQRARKHGDPLTTRSYVVPGNGTCRVCGLPAPRRSSRGFPPLYCSPRCRQAASYERRRDTLNAQARIDSAELRSTTLKVCPQCDSTFTPTVTLKQRFCSKQCRRRASRDTQNRTCEASNCGRSVRARGLCSKHYRRWERENGKASPPKWDEKRRAAWKARYALTRGAADAESFDYREVYERDGWVCGICQKPVDSELRWPDPMSVSLDHVVPVSRGGRHSRDNAQCAHLCCNVSKGAAA